jgi:two-component system CheB/CheR fusion protein
MDRLRKDFNVQIFATDIDTDAVESARQSLYPASISVDVPSEILERHFTKEDSFYRVKKEVRDMVVFAVQNVIADPPFSKMDLISCRNLMIYLNGELQRRVLPVFHYALKREGFLFLGSSETIGEFSDHFAVENRKWKLFRRRETDLVKPLIPDISHGTAIEPSSLGQVLDSEPLVRQGNLRHMAEAAIVADYGPTSIVINDKKEILYVLGRAGKYLEATTGRFPPDIVAMAREGLKLHLAAAIRKATLQKAAVRSENLLVKTNGKDQMINLVVKPLADAPMVQGMFIVIFEDVSQDDRQSSKQPNRWTRMPRIILGYNSSNRN